MNDNVDWEAAIRPVLEHVWKVIHERLVKLRDRLDPWLNGMLAGPIPANWREELARFAEQTHADGLVIRPEGMAVLEKTIQGRVDAEARQKQRATAVLAAPVASLPSNRASTAVGSSKSPGRVAKSTGATFFNGDGERQRGAQVAALVEREVNGKTWVYFQKEPGGPWFGVPKKTYFLHDAAGNLLNDSFGIPRSARDLTGAKEVDWFTATSLNHPADAGWAKIAKQYGGLLPIDPQELREDLSKSGSVAGPLIRYTAKTAAFVVIAGAFSKGLGKGVEKGAKALLGRGEKEIVKHAVEETAKAAEAAKIAESAAGKQAVKSGRKAAQKAESALAKESAAGESAAAKAETQAQANLAESAKLEPYGGSGGGHHPVAKKAFEGAPGYNPKQALAIPNSELKALGVNHHAVTGAQSSLYSAFAKTKKPLTWEIIEEIETKALVKGGLGYERALATVQKAVQALKEVGVSGPTRIPWGG